MSPAKKRSPRSPIGLGRAQAAAYIGADEALFVRLVEAGTMPKPRSIRSMQVWDADELADAFRRLPRWAPRADIAEANRAAEPAEHSSGHPNAYNPVTLAERWQCSERHVRNMIERGELPAFRAGGKLLRIRGDVVEAFERGEPVESAERAAPPEAIEPEKVHADEAATSKPETRRKQDDAVFRAHMRRLRDQWERERLARERSTSE